MEQKPKNPWLSKTVILSLFGVILGIFQVLTQNPFLVEHAAWLMTIYNGLMFVQRYLTIFNLNKAVEEVKEDK